jgi:tRNA(Arg) A34 adenosine deaminase TadA
MTDTDYMKQALLEAQKAGERGEVPVGAVVVCKDRIIARAHNLTETLTDVTAHAEMQAITAAATLGGKYLNECTLYVTVEPCVMCAGAIAWAQTGRLVFGDMALYTMVKNNTFNGMPLPDIAVMDENKDCKVIRRFKYEDFKCRLS